MQNPIHLAFDIGHSSIGWSVMEVAGSAPNILGCGSVIFPKDDCLASARRTHRRMRRNIRSTRKRIENMRRLLSHLRVLTDEDLSAPGHPAPHVLAAKALVSDAPCLSWLEVWHVLRWYAHNRGYDGNARWSGHEEDSDDTDKEKVAIQLMLDHDTQTMAETICAVLGLDPSGAKISSDAPFKTHSAAFPREVVRDEVLRILRLHESVLPALNADFISSLIALDLSNEHRAWETIKVPAIQLPRRYFGGLLFGQLVPRFDNRLIGTCPFSESEKGDKLPNKDSVAFRNYRWAMILANLRANGEPLSCDARKELHQIMEAKGKLTPRQLREHVEEITGTEATNCKSYFEITPNAGDALILDPVVSFIQAAEGKPRKNTITMSHFWPHLSAVTKKRAPGRWRKKRRVDLTWMLDECRRENHDPAPLNEAADVIYAADQKKSRSNFSRKEELLRRPFSPKLDSGRAPFSRSKMKEVFEFVINSNQHPAEDGGPIYRDEAQMDRMREKKIDDQTNNHLVRHRIRILRRLLDDIVEEFCGGKKLLVADVVVEVARDLQEFSGITAKEMAGELGKRLSHFRQAVKRLEERLPGVQLTGSLIRKCRIATDLNFTCPFTGDVYDEAALSRLEWEHIIPYADRPTNALDSLVLTWREVNDFKGRRTGLQFVQDDGGSSVPGRSQLSILPEASYRELVEKLKVARKDSYPDDFRRQSSRKKWLLVESYERADREFTAGSLTQTSHLNRIAAREVEKYFFDEGHKKSTASVISIPGQVTAEIRKGWDLLHTLTLACPEVENESKTKVRELTNLHHALDAVTIALTQFYLPGTSRLRRANEKGAIWQALLKRRKSEAEINLLVGTGIFKKCLSKNRDGRERADVSMIDLNSGIKQMISERLAEKRVAQHIPADQSGAVLEQNPWRVWRVDGNPENPKTEVHLKQRSFEVKEGRRIFKHKKAKEKAGKLVGLKPGKLAKNKSVLVIAENYGIALDPVPVVVPFHNVPKRLDAIRLENGGEKSRVLRKGMLIEIQNWPGKEGIWRIFSAKSPAHLDIARVDAVTMESKGEGYWRQVSVASLLKKDALNLLDHSLTGISGRRENP